MQTYFEEFQIWTYQLPSSEFGWYLTALIIGSILSFYCIFYFLRHGRIMEDTPTSKIRSASQGFAEISGRAKSIDEPLKAPGTGTLCSWYEYTVEERRPYNKSYSDNADISRLLSNISFKNLARGTAWRGDDWETVVYDISTYSFYVDDGTGLCAVDPEKAEVRNKTHKTWRRGDRIYTEERIDEGEEIYCLGQFETEQGPSREKVIKESARAILNKLKQDQEKMIKLLDRNGDGEIDMEEWERARKAADKKARAEVKADYSPSQHHVLIKPFNKSHPYLISAYNEAELTKRYKIYSGISLATFLLTGVTAVFMSITRGLM